MTTEYREALYREALSYLYQISDEDWRRVCGDQSREQFASLSVDKGESAALLYLSLQGGAA